MAQWCVAYNVEAMYVCSCTDDSGPACAGVNREYATCTCKGKATGNSWISLDDSAGVCTRYCYVAVQVWNILATLALFDQL